MIYKPPHFEHMTNGMPSMLIEELKELSFLKARLSLVGMHVSLAISS